MAAWEPWMAKKTLKPNRKYVPLAPGIIDHLRYLRGCRLSVYILVLIKTAYRHTWAGWRTKEISERVGYNPRQVRIALRELSQINNITGRKYIENLQFSRNPTGGGNRLTVVNPVLNWE